MVEISQRRYYHVRLWPYYGHFILSSYVDLLIVMRKTTGATGGAYNTYPGHIIIIPSFKILLGLSIRISLPTVSFLAIICLTTRPYRHAQSPYKNKTTKNATAGLN